MHLHLKLRRLEAGLHKVIELMNETEPWYDSEKTRPIIPRKKQQEKNRQIELFSKMH